MYALRPLSPDPNSTKHSELRKRKRIVSQRKQQSAHLTLAVESIVKLSVNVLLSAAGIAGLMQLIPYRTAQEVKLKELQAAVNASQHRLQKTQSMFSNVFDPYRSTAMMQEQANRIEGERKQIVFGNSGVSSAPKKP